jgi:hypothetical protein
VNPGTIAIIAIAVAIVSLVAAMLALFRFRKQAPEDDPKATDGVSPPPSTP